MHSGTRLMIVLMSLAWAVAGCTRPASSPLRLTPAGDESTRIVIHGPASVGPLCLWVPEGIMSEAGACSVYPIGRGWTQHGECSLDQEVKSADNFGPGNCRQVDDHTVDLAGVILPKDSPVAWRTIVESRGHEVVFTIRLTNTGTQPIRKAGVPVCLKFLNAPWWSEDRTFVRSQGQIRSLMQLGRDAGSHSDFEAYLVHGQTFDNVFYEQFWGFNADRLDVPVMVSEHTTAGLCVGVTAEKAYFLHSNRGNPCTDIMLAFGTIQPAESAQATGRVWIRTGQATDFLAGSR